MKNAILIPGRPDREEWYNPDGPSNSNRHWFPWASKQLLVKDIHAVAIEMPMAFMPRYDAWKKEFERFDITEETILVGHSCGGGFLLRWLSENKDKKVGKVVLVAPWINPENNPESDTADFFEFEIDSKLVARTNGVTIFVSKDDFETIKDTVRIIIDKDENVTTIEFENYGLFCYKVLKTDAFPELLK
ncbi:MAG: alpha/beta hydrolase, partial [Candidatus Saccharibacteria bacterium]|nr:alpha/beta hydrolase [Candidatus Saccharibacteria bacterium]